jgi:hypothetical protein
LIIVLTVIRMRTCLSHGYAIIFYEQGILKKGLDNAG